MYLSKLEGLIDTTAPVPAALLSSVALVAAVSFVLQMEILCGRRARERTKHQQSLLCYVDFDLTELKVVALDL